MKIEPCVGDFFAVTAERDEEITSKDIQKALRLQGMTWIGATTKYAVNKESQMVHTWVWPKEDCLIKLNFRSCFHPYLMVMLVRVLNDWGYDVLVIKNFQDKLLFERSEIFYQDALSKMMGS